MSHQPAVALTRPYEQAPAFQLAADYSLVALENLRQSYAAGLPLALLIGGGKFGMRELMNRFLSDLDEEITACRVATPGTDALSFMRGIIGGLGFETDALDTADLGKILDLFLTFQESHGKRTVICIEEAHNADRVVLDRVRRLVEAEVRQPRGLLVVLAGGRGLRTRLHEPPLDAITAYAESRIALVPFTLAETRDYVRRQVELCGNESIGEAFEFDAVTLIHELGAGIPDYVSDLYSMCRVLADERDAAPVTAAMVIEASNLLELAAKTRESWTEAALPEPAGLQIVATLHGRRLARLPLDGAYVLIGRDERCDVCVPSRLVSRHHAIVFDVGGGMKIADLGSTNGTIVNGDKITQRTLRDGDVVVVGECRIEVHRAG